MGNLARWIGLAAIVLGLVAGAQAPAKAGLTFNFSYDIPTFGGPDTTASGVLTTTDVLNPDGSYTVTAITGTRTANGITDTITGLLPPGSIGFNDNELFPTAPFLDFDGISFTIDNLNNGNFLNQVNVYFDGTAYSEDVDGAGEGSFIISPVPEPSSLAMCGIAGAIGLVVAGARRERPGA